ncbi:hypothetical protein [Croceicoccus hydrothermalis]|uniref:hypothetical protein n=1 Tax=Croceicoccus hydrothermalis TaxID=2867964 RepID=UPI001EFAAD25|nr:hypothetical protein [Croceicoccus hydrothermalis]
MIERFRSTPVGWSAAASLVAMLALNVFALSQQMQASSQGLHFVAATAGYLA